MRESILIFLFVVVLITFGGRDLGAQCCSVGAGYSTLPPSLRNSALEENDFFAAGLNTNYTYYKDYFRRDISVENGLTQRQKVIINTLTLIKSFFQDYTLQADISYIPYFYQDNGHFEIDRHSISAMKINLGYSLLRNYDESIFSQLVVGTKIPLEKDSSKVISYERAYSVSLMSNTLKKFEELDLLLSLVLRYEKFLTATDDKQPGDNYNLSIIASKVLGNFALTADLNYLYSGREVVKNKIWNASGHHLLQISPQLSYNLSNFVFDVRLDLPLYKYYKKFQITPSYAISFNINYIYK